MATLIEEQQTILQQVLAVLGFSPMESGVLTLNPKHFIAQGVCKEPPAGVEAGTVVLISPTPHSGNVFSNFPNHKAIKHNFLFANGGWTIEPPHWLMQVNMREEIKPDTDTAASGDAYDAKYSDVSHSWVMIGDLLEHA